MPEASELLERVQPATIASKNIKTLIYGEPGSGKTVLAAGAPKPLLIDTEKGARSLLNHPELAETPVLRINTYEEINTLVKGLRNGELDAYETIVLDSISELQRRKLDEQMDKVIVKDPKRNPYVPAQYEYNENTNILRRLMVALADLPNKNIIVIAHEREAQDGESGPILIRPDLTPKLANTLQGIFDLIGRLAVDRDDKGDVTRRYLQVHATRRVKAKTRLKLPTFVENPTFQMLVDANVPSDGKEGE